MFLWKPVLRIPVCLNCTHWKIYIDQILEFAWGINWSPVSYGSLAEDRWLPSNLVEDGFCFLELSFWVIEVKSLANALFSFLKAVFIADTWALVVCGPCAKHFEYVSILLYLFQNFGLFEELNAKNPSTVSIQLHKILLHSLLKWNIYGIALQKTLKR